MSTWRRFSPGALPRSGDTSSSRETFRTRSLVPSRGPHVRGPGNAWKVSSIGSEQLRQEQIAAFEAHCMSTHFVGSDSSTSLVAEERFPEMEAFWRKTKKGQLRSSRRCATDVEDDSEEPGASQREQRNAAIKAAASHFHLAD